MALAMFVLAGDTILAQCPAAMKLTVGEGFIDPIGFHDTTPVFSWQLPQDGSVERQTAYRIVVATATAMLPDQADLWDSGKVEDSRSVQVPYRGKSLTSRQQVFWQVQFWDEQGRASHWSVPARFELGFLNNKDWSGQWIRMKQEPEVQEDAPACFIPEYLRKEFVLPTQVVSARLYITARGLYEVYLNGRRVGRDVMVPGYTPLSKDRDLDL